MRRGCHIGRLLLALVVCLCGAQQAMAVGTVIIDLDAVGATGTFNGGIFEQIHISSTGTGVIQPFLRVQTNNGFERGYNTGGTLEFDATAPWTKALSLSDVPVVELNGTDYRQFLLDINQDGSSDGRYISLDEIEIYQADVANLTGFEVPPVPLNGQASFVWKLDDGFDPGTDDAWILLNYKLNPGSGAGDMFAYIPNELFDADLDYVYLYSEFGVNRPNTSNFEEWAVMVGGDVPPPPPPPVVPVPGALLLVLLGGFGVSLQRQRLL